MLNDLKLIFYLATFFGILPPYSFQKRTFRFVAQFRFYSLLLLILISYAYYDSVYGKIKFLHKYMRETTIIIQSILYLLVAGFNIISIIEIAFRNTKRLSKCLNLICEAHTISPERKTNVLIYFISGYVLLLFVLFYDGFIWDKTITFRLYKYYIPSRVQYVFIYTVLLLVFGLARSVYLKFHSINKTLILDITRNEEERKKRAFYKELLDLYTKITEIVEIFNTIFGWIIFALLIMLSVGLLEALNFIIALSFGNYDHYTTIQKINIIFVSLCFTFILLVNKIKQFLSNTVIAFRF